MPPFGANGLAFSSDGTLLYVANTGNDSVVKIPVSGGAAGTAVLAAQHQWCRWRGRRFQRQHLGRRQPVRRDRRFRSDRQGDRQALASFNGIDARGAARGLLFPASLVFSGESVLVTNLVLDLGTVFGLPTVDSQWAAQVTPLHGQQDQPAPAAGSPGAQG